MTTNWREKLVECHPHKEDTDDYPFSMSRLVKLIHEARRAALEEAALQLDALDTFDGHEYLHHEAMYAASRKVRSLAAKEGET